MAKACFAPQAFQMKSQVFQQSERAVSKLDRWQLYLNG
ncbi:MAG: hypothetical protein OJF51_002979 [Nitrospira sp.]|nr:MAG: hypothetical protein OJF51_002979 [Nitrospira sp.]